VLTSRCEWNGLPAIEHRSAEVTVVVLPGRGGKIVSLRALGWEWLAQPVLPLGPTPAPGDTFVDSDMCGWDECAPSIVECEVPGDTAHGGGLRLPDHGELWTAPWQVGADDETRLWVQGPASRCTFARTVTIGSGADVRLDYQVTAGDTDAVYLWAAHPQLRAPAGTRVLLGGSRDGVVDVNSGPEPRRQPWHRDLAEVDTLAPATSRKYYLEPTDTTASAGVELPDGRTLTMHWDPELLAYLGIWFDRSQFSHEDVLAIEPSTGWYDSAARALAHHRALVIPARSTVAWWLELSFAGPSGPAGLPAAAGGQPASPLHTADGGW